ncbi:MAG: ornithine cyclodeaminase [Bacteroidaceae bacterium]|nr:ornithine cyclodeaminase [Bacteroidaceae bacterium]
MQLISQQQIKNLNISPTECVEWIKESFSLKEKAILPHKISVNPRGNDFFNTMPCLLPSPYNYFGVKEVHRIKGAVPALGGDILLYSSLTGELLAMLDSDWITAMRTGAVATLAIKTFRKNNTEQYGFVGLGNTARATMLCLLHTEPDVMHNVALLRYKDQAEKFIERFNEYKNVSFTIYDDIKELVSQSDVIVSCITDADGLLCDNNTLYREGCLVVPVHTRGSQNCDLFFDKVFADDTAHVCGFKYFNQFKQFAEIQDVLEGKKKGRETDTERILSYNIGLGLHDVVFAGKIYELLKGKSCNNIEYVRETEKFWV